MAPGHPIFRIKDMHNRFKVSVHEIIVDECRRSWIKQSEDIEICFDPDSTVRGGRLEYSELYSFNLDRFCSWDAGIPTLVAASTLRRSPIVLEKNTRPNLYWSPPLLPGHLNSSQKVLIRSPARRA
jgi:hypothetical protein